MITTGFKTIIDQNRQLVEKEYKYGKKNSQIACKEKKRSEAKV